jgi:hypothetical protein
VRSSLFTTRRESDLCLAPYGAGLRGKYERQVRYGTDLMGVEQQD